MLRTRSLCLPSINIRILSTIVFCCKAAEKSAGSSSIDAAVLVIGEAIEMSLGLERSQKNGVTLIDLSASEPGEIMAPTGTFQPRNLDDIRKDILEIGAKASHTRCWKGIMSLNSPFLVE